MLPSEENLLQVTSQGESVEFATLERLSVMRGPDAPSLCVSLLEIGLMHSNLPPLSTDLETTILDDVSLSSPSCRIFLVYHHPKHFRLQLRQQPKLCPLRLLHLVFLTVSIQGLILPFLFLLFFVITKERKNTMKHFFSSPMLLLTEMAMRGACIALGTGLVAGFDVSLDSVSRPGSIPDSGPFSGSSLAWTSAPTRDKLPDDRPEGLIIQYDAPWGLRAISHSHRLVDDEINDEIFEYDSSAGQDIWIFVLDDGVDDAHPDLEGRVLHRYDATRGSRGPSNRTLGTAVAGVAAGSLCGVAKSAIIVDVQIGVSGKPRSIDHMVYGFNWVLGMVRRYNKQGSSVVNLSIGDDVPICPEELEYLVMLLEEERVLTVMAAGNNGTDVSKICPAGWGHGLVVAAMHDGYRRVAASNYGPGIDLFAPGQFIYAPVSTFTGYHKQFDYWYGTAVAAPFVSGTVAYILGIDEEYRDFDIPSLKEWILSRATKGLVEDVQGSPDRLLYTVFGGR